MGFFGTIKLLIKSSLNAWLCGLLFILLIVAADAVYAEMYSKHEDNIRRFFDELIFGSMYHLMLLLMFIIPIIMVGFLYKKLVVSLKYNIILSALAALIISVLPYLLSDTSDGEIAILSIWAGIMIFVTYMIFRKALIKQERYLENK